MRNGGRENKKWKKKEEKKNGGNSTEAEFDEKETVGVRRCGKGTASGAKAGPASGLKTDETWHSSANRFTVLCRRARDRGNGKTRSYLLPLTVRIPRKPDGALAEILAKSQQISFLRRSDINLHCAALIKTQDLKVIISVMRRK